MQVHGIVGARRFEPETLALNYGEMGSTGKGCDVLSRFRQQATEIATYPTRGDDRDAHGAFPPGLNAIGPRRSLHDPSARKETPDRRRSLENQPFWHAAALAAHAHRAFFPNARLSCGPRTDTPEPGVEVLTLGGDGLAGIGKLDC